MNRHTNKPGMAGYSTMKKTYNHESMLLGDERLMNLTKRYCVRCTWEEFCAKLYEVLYSEMAGWDKTEMILNRL